MGFNNDPSPHINRVYGCIEEHLNVNVRNVPIKYFDFNDFYYMVKANTEIPSECYEDTDFIKEFYKMTYDITPGFYKRKDKIVIIKKENKFDESTLLPELLHSRSITQYYEETEKWIHEGLPHFIAKILSERCKIDWRGSEWEKFFIVWEEIYKSYNLEFLKTIIFSDNIYITKFLLKRILNYNRDDVLTISFEKAKRFLNIN